MSTRPKVNRYLFGLVVLVCAFVAFMIGTVVSNHLRLDDFSNEFQPNSTSRNVRTSLPRTPQDAESLTNIQSLFELEDPIRFKSPFVRTRALRKLLSKSDIDALQEHLVQSQSLTRHHLQEEVQNRIFQQLAVINPTAALATVREKIPPERRKTFLVSIFREWSLLNLDEAIEQAQHLDLDSKQSVIRSLISARQDLSLAERRKIGRKLDHEWLAIEILKSTTNTPVIQDPKQEWDWFVKKNSGRLQDLRTTETRLLGQIAYAWVLKDGASVFEKIYSELSPTVSLFETTKLVSHELVEESPRSSIDLVVNMLQIEQNPQYRELAVNLMQSWASKDPFRALVATHTISAPSLQIELQRRVLQQWAKDEPQTVLDKIDQLPESVQDDAREFALIEIGKQRPESVVDALHGLSNSVSHESVAKSLAEHWAKRNFTNTLDWIDSDLSISHLKHELKSIAFGALASFKPDTALEIARRQPLDETGKGWEAEVIARLAWEDLDQATKLLSQVRPGATRVHAYDRVIMRTLLHENDTEQSVDLLLQLCAQETNIRPNISLNLVSRYAPERLFLSINDIENATIRSFAARSLYWEHRDSHVFSVEQLELLQEIGRTTESELSTELLRELKTAQDIMQLMPEN